MLEPVTPQFPEALTLPQQARAVVVTNQETYNTAADMKKTFAGWRKRIVDEFAPMKEAAHKAHKAITAKEAEYLKPVTEAEDILKASIIAYQNEQERLRRIEQARLEAEARAAAEADAKRRREEAEAIRLQEQEAALQAAIAAGVDEVPEVAPVEAFIEPAPYVAPVVAAPTFVKATGTGIRETWGYRITDMKALCASIGSGETPEHYVEGTTALGERARSDKQALKIPGVVPVRK